MKKPKSTKYIIISDESIRSGNLFSYFYGGCIVKESLYENISNVLNLYKDFLGLHEIKREKINSLNVGNYKKVLDLFFSYVRAGDIKIRIMYTPNNQLNQYPHGQDELYAKLYYTFIKRAFSLFFAEEDINLKIFMDELPESLSLNNSFKRHLITGFINESKKHENKISLYINNIVEVDSKDHVLLQCIDVVLGVIEFYLNHKDVTSKRGKAKIEIFNHIFENYIKVFCPNFDFQISTGYFNCLRAWHSPYKHLVFKKKKPPN